MTFPVKNRIGVFGGSFDPVHRGHVQLAKLAFSQCQMNSLILVPCSVPPHRAPAQATDVQRTQMLSLALRGLDNFSICDFELNKRSTSFTVETLEFLRGTHRDAEFVFCLGSDSLHDFNNWHRPADILAIAHLAVMRRELKELDNIDRGLRERLIYSQDDMVDSAGQILVIDSPELPVSATLIRRHLQKCGRDSAADLMAHTNSTIEPIEPIEANSTIEAKKQFQQDGMLSSWLNPHVLNYIVDNKVYQ